MGRWEGQQLTPSETELNEGAVIVDGYGSECFVREDEGEVEQEEAEERDRCPEIGHLQHPDEGESNHSKYYSPSKKR